jgi:hypothetical protein
MTIGPMLRVTRGRSHLSSTSQGDVSGAAAVSKHVLADEDAIVHSELGEHFGEVVSDGSVADERLLTDLWIGETRASEPGSASNRRPANANA